MDQEEKQLRHASLMSQEFNPEKVKALRDELMSRRTDIIEMLPYVDITSELGKARFWKLQGELELVDNWLALPEKTKTFLETAKGYINKFFVR